MVLGEECLQIQSEVVHLNLDTGRVAGSLHDDGYGFRISMIGRQGRCKLVRCYAVKNRMRIWAMNEMKQTENNEVFKFKQVKSKY